MSNFRAILIAGPTASGKSQLAIEIAERIDGVIVNADSMQVYDDLHILTARPSLSDMALVTHALYGFVPGGSAYSAGRYALDAERVIGECLEAGKMPILVGAARGFTSGRSWTVCHRFRRYRARFASIGAVKQNAWGRVTCTKF